MPNEYKPVAFPEQQVARYIVRGRIEDRGEDGVYGRRKWTKTDKVNQKAPGFVDAKTRSRDIEKEKSKG